MFPDRQRVPLCAAVGPLPGVFCSFGPGNVNHIAGPHAFLRCDTFVPASPSIEPEEEKRRLFAAMTHFVMEEAAQHPVLLVVEDIHWCDDLSLDLLLHLARRCRQVQQLLLRDQQPTNFFERQAARIWGELALAQGEATRALAIAEHLLTSAPGNARPRPIPHLLCGSDSYMPRLICSQRKNLSTLVRLPGKRLVV